MNNLIRLRRYLISVAVAMTAMFVMPSMAFADEGGAPVVVEGSGSHYVLSPTVWKIVVGLVLPFLIGFITKQSMSSFAKGIVGIVVAAVSALVIRWTTLDGSMVFDSAALQDIFMVYGVQLLTYLGVYSKVNAGAGINAHLAPGFGLGPSTA